MIFFAATAKAVEATGQNDSLSALRDYVQSIDTGAKLARSPDQNSKNVDQNQTVDAAYAAFRTFADRIDIDRAGVDRGPAEIGRSRQSARFFAWIEFSRHNLLRHLGPAYARTVRSRAERRQAHPSKPPLSARKFARPAMRARPNSFKHTLMGRIGKTQKGKFDCENCHGPGSAHVKAGGGRGVGGIISFRPEDQSRTAEENNAICLACHEQGRPDLLERQHARDARSDVHELPHRHETCVAQVPTEDRFRARHLLPVPQGPARADVPLVAYAAARRQDRVLRLP